jgi:ABC-type transporter Mla subunit MlaD
MLLKELILMDDKILEILKQIQENQQETNSRLDRIEKKLDGVVEQTADLTEFRIDISEKLDKLINVTKDNCFEISNLKVIK